MEIKFVSRPAEGRPRADIPDVFNDVIEALLAEPVPTGWADLREFFPHRDVRDAFLRRLRRRAVIATAGAGRYVRILELKKDSGDSESE